jgi:hypothetical protein
MNHPIYDGLLADSGVKTPQSWEGSSTTVRSTRVLLMR